MIKLNVGHKYATKYYSVLKRKEILIPVIAKMTLKDITQRDRSPMDRDTYCLIQLV